MPCCANRDEREEEDRRDRAFGRHRGGAVSMTATVRVGFIPLVDAALLVAASELGFAEHEGLHLDLRPGGVLGQYPGQAQSRLFRCRAYAGPAAIASSLGLGHVTVDTIAPVALGLNGNAITVSPRLARHAWRGRRWGSCRSGRQPRALCKLVRERARNGQAPLTFGHVFPFSSHHYQLRLWMQAGGVDPVVTSNLVVLPPPFMVQSLEKWSPRWILRWRSLEQPRRAGRHRAHPALWDRHRARLRPRRCSGSAPNGTGRIPRRRTARPGHRHGSALVRRSQQF